MRHRQFFKGGLFLSDLRNAHAAPTVWRGTRSEPRWPILAQRDRVARKVGVTLRIRNPRLDPLVKSPAIAGQPPLAPTSSSEHQDSHRPTGRAEGRVPT